MSKPMNEEIDKELTRLVSIANRTEAGQVTHQIEKIKAMVLGIEHEAYLQGAEDMREEVKPLNHASASWNTGYYKDYHQQIIDLFDRKAQQFIDSLEEKDDSGDGLELKRQESVKKMSAKEHLNFIETNYPYEYQVRTETHTYWTYKPKPSDIVISKRKGNSFVGYLVIDSLEKGENNE